MTLWFTLHKISTNLQITFLCKMKMLASLYEYMFKKYCKTGLPCCNLMMVLGFVSVQTPLSSCPLLLREKTTLFTLLLS